MQEKHIFNHNKNGNRIIIAIALNDAAAIKRT